MKKLVVYTERITRCPHGQGYGLKHEDVPITQCIIDRNTPGTYCHTSNCDHVDRLENKRPINRMLVRITDTQHRPQPVLLYPYVSDDGKVFIVNAYTDERKELDLSFTVKKGSSYPIIERRTSRKTTDGSLLSYPYTGWKYGGAVVQERSWCDCMLCQNSRPVAVKATTIDIADKYGRDLPKEYQPFWYKYVWRYILRNGPINVPLRKDLIAGKRHMRSLLRTAKSIKERKNLRKQYKEYKLLIAMLRQGLLDN